MSEQRPYRAGLGLPEAVIIRSHDPPGVLEEDRPSYTYTPDPRRAPPKWDSYAAWKEWNTNPAKHGPERLTRAPIFLPSSSNYDDLGRSIADGVGVIVDEGQEKIRVESGESVADWYKALSTGSSRMGTPEAGPSSKRSELSREPAELSHSDEAGRSERPKGVPSVRVHSGEWFIRRALLTSSRFVPPAPAPTPSSIGNLLQMPTVRPTMPAQYVLGPENRGYAMLDRLGWSGGGLGRPEGWIGKEKGKERATPPTNDGIIDLTAESDEEVGSASGPGRTAPIATTLKLDRLGLGHRRAQPREHLESTKKKITHTAAEIRQAQKRARYAPKGGVELGKKGKVRWKERDKKEREERRRLAAALNA
jgi:hypothetical protein